MNSIQEVSQTILLNPLFELLRFFYSVTGNFGFAIILLTIIIRTALIPFTLPTIKSQKRMREMKPELDEIKRKHKGDAKKLQEAQIELFKKHNINPLSGCIPYIFQIIVIFALYAVLSSFVQKATAMGIEVQTMFFGLDLAKPDKLYIIPVVAAVTQFFLSLMLLPGLEKHDLVNDAGKTRKEKKENDKETDTQEMMETMQKQMVFLMPIMTGIAAVSFPAGLGVYWIVTTIFSIVQQWVVSGPGGLADLLPQIRSMVKKR